MANIQVSTNSSDILKRKHKGILPGSALLKDYKQSAKDDYNAKEAVDCFCSVSLPSLNPDLFKLKAPWAQKAVKNLSEVIIKASHFCEQGIKSRVNLQKNKQNTTIGRKEKLEASLLPLHRHILSFISNKQHLKGQEPCFDLDAEILKCRYLEISLLFGIFLMTPPKEGDYLVSTLMDAIQMKPMVYRSSAYARLQGDPGMMCTKDFFNNEMMVNSAIKKFKHANQMEKTPLALIRSMSMKTFGELIPHVVGSQRQQDFPDKEMLSSVQDFFVYVEHEGRCTFEKLDLDADGKVTLSDLKFAMSKMNLPTHYAQKLMPSKGRIWPVKTLGLSEFCSVLQEKEPIMVNLFNSLGVSKSGTLQRENLRDSLKRAGLVATEANITSMMKFMGASANGSIKYGQFREFMMLIPTDELNLNPWGIWLRASTIHELDSSASDGYQTSLFNYVTTISKALPQSPMYQRSTLK